jgi:hypothetical protein
MSYRKVSKNQARKMAKAAGLVKNQIQRCDFRDGMAEHAARLIIAWTAREKRGPYKKRVTE